jgi:hypothetical protein
MQQSTVKLVSIGPDVTNCKALPIKYQPTMEFISPAVASPTGSRDHLHLHARRVTLGTGPSPQVWYCHITGALGQFCQGTLRQWVGT